MRCLWGRNHHRMHSNPSRWHGSKSCWLFYRQNHQYSATRTRPNVWAFRLQHEKCIHTVATISAALLRLVRACADRLQGCLLCMPVCFYTCSGPSVTWTCVQCTCTHNSCTEYVHTTEGVLSNRNSMLYFGVRAGRDRVRDSTESVTRKPVS